MNIEDGAATSLPKTRSKPVAKPRYAVPNTAEEFVDHYERLNKMMEANAYGSWESSVKKTRYGRDSTEELPTVQQRSGRNRTTAKPSKAQLRTAQE